MRRAIAPLRMPSSSAAISEETPPASAGANPLLSPGIGAALASLSVGSPPITPLLPSCSFPSNAPSSFVEAVFEKARSACYPAVHPCPYKDAFIDLKDSPPIGRGGEGVIQPVVVSPIGGPSFFAVEKVFFQKTTSFPEYCGSIGFDHPHLIKAYHFSEKGIVYPEASGDLEKLFQSEKLEETQFFLAIESVLSALKYLHEKGWVHGDVKGSNILFLKSNSGETGRFVLSDYGNTRRIEAEFQDSHLGTAQYLAPEVARWGAKKEASDRPTPKIDLFSLGMLIFYSLAPGKNPYAFGESWPLEPSQIFYALGLQGGKMKEDLSSLIDRELASRFDPTGKLEALMLLCLNQDPAKRPTAAQALKWLNSN